jgi:cell division protein FtsI (penicillin-binding protein 3)
VLKHLSITPTTNWSSSLTSNPIWGKAKTSSTGISLTQSAPTAANVVPDVEGMGARDAVYALEHRGVKVYVEGRGKVVSQSLPPGHVIKKGDVCRLKFDI